MIICATTATTIHYLSSKVLRKNKSQNQIKDFITLFEISSVNRTVIKKALKSIIKNQGPAPVFRKLAGDNPKNKGGAKFLERDRTDSQEQVRRLVEAFSFGL